MIKIKYFADAVESDDGPRLWVEPIGLTRDLQEWCAINHAIHAFAPPLRLWRWIEQHPDGYEYFRARYHEHLARSPYRSVLQQLAAAALRDDFTLVHQGEELNTATALYEFLTEFSAYCPPE